MDRFAPYLHEHRARRVAAEAARSGLCARARAEAEAAAERMASRLGVRRVILFGSLARGTFRAGSDLDLAVEGLAEGRILDAHAVASDACPFDVNVVPVERARPGVREAIEAEGIVLWPR